MSVSYRLATAIILVATAAIVGSAVFNILVVFSVARLAADEPIEASRSLVCRQKFHSQQLFFVNTTGLGGGQ